MMYTKKGLLSVVLLSLTLAVFGQEKYYTKTGKLSFFSSTALENIEAVHKSGVVLLNTKTGDLQVALLMKGFEFKKALMQEHFNESYVESDKFPKAEFKGQLTNHASIQYTTNGSYPASVKGKLTLHGVTRDVEASGTIQVKDGKLQLISGFQIAVADYNISIPKVYRDNIAKTIKISVDCVLSAL